MIPTLGETMTAKVIRWSFTDCEAQPLGKDVKTVVLDCDDGQGIMWLDFLSDGWMLVISYLAENEAGIDYANVLAEAGGGRRIAGWRYPTELHTL